MGKKAKRLVRSWVPRQAADKRFKRYVRSTFETVGRDETLKKIPELKPETLDRWLVSWGIR